MDVSEHDEFKCFDETPTFNYCSISSTLPPAGLQLECEQSLKKFIKREGTSPTREYVEEHEEESPSGIPNDPLEETCEVDNDSKEWFVKTEAEASPSRSTSDVNQDQTGLQVECEQSRKKFIKREVTSPTREYVEEHEEESPSDMPNDPLEVDSKEWFVKTEARSTSDVEQNPGPADKQTRGRDQCFQCPYCPLTVELQSELQIHVDSLHKKQNIFQCPHCHYKAKLKSVLKRHIDSVHKKIKACKCPLCEYSCRSDNCLEAHIISVHKKTKFRCPYCDYRTGYKRSLKSHVDHIHKKIFAFQCTYCDYKTSWKGALKGHIDAVHYNFRPFPCPHCTYKSNTKRGLQLHIDSVHKKIKKIKAFKCPNCKFKTSNKSYLKTHIDTQHINRKKYECPFCGFKVLRVTTLQLHIHKKHNN